MKPRAKVSASATTSPPDAGVRGATRVIDRYEIVAVIGRGVTGAVYRAVDTRLGRTVALKTATGSRDSARLTDRVRQRFLREAMALSKVDQRNVVQVLDYGFADDGTPFLVMEHLPGRDLGAFLALAEGPLPVPDVADIGIEIKVLDFGVSMAAAADDRTRQSQPVPASHHLAPEQIDGKVGPASDQYALGVLLHFCLTRRFPDSLRGGRARSAGVQLPPGLEAVLRRATRMAPAERFESVYELGRELLDFASSRGQAQWRGYYRPQPDAQPAWAVLSPTKRLRPAGTPPPGAARAVTSTKVPRRPGEGPARATGTWPLRAATVGCVALAATGLGISRRRPPRPAPPLSARREIAPPPHHPAGERGFARTHERTPLVPAVVKPKAPPVVRPIVPPVSPPVVVTEASLAPVSPLEAPEPAPAATRRHAKTAPAAPAPIPNIDGAGIWIPAE